MANDVQIDSISLEISSDSSQASQSLDKLVGSLNSLKQACGGGLASNLTKVANSLSLLTSVKDYGTTASGITQVATALKSLNGINTKAGGLNTFASSLNKLAGQDISGLATHLGRLTTSFGKLNGIDLKTTGFTTFASTIKSMASGGAKVDDIATGMDKLTGSFRNLSGLDLKVTGISQFMSTVTKLATADLKNFNPSALRLIYTFLSNISNLNIDVEKITSIGKILSAINTITAKGDKIPQTASELPALTKAVEDFISSMATMPQVADSTVRLTESLATMASNGKSASISLRDTGKSMQSNSGSMKVATAIVDSFGSSIKTLINLFKKFGSVSVSAIKGLASQLAKIGSAGISKIKELGTELQNLKRPTVNVRSLTSNLKMLLATVIGFHGIRGAFNWLKESVVAGADVAETNHIIEETFGDMADQVDGWANKAISQFGIAEVAAKRYAGTLSAMFQASGTAQKDAARMSTDLVGLAGDLSSFYNIDTETAFNKIKSGMAGMVRPLRDLGIDLSVASLKEYALAQGITKSYTSMTQAEKVMLRYRYLMDVTSKQQGDFSKTSGSMANSLRMLRAYAASVRDAIGQGLVSALRHGVHALNIAMRVILKASNAFRVFMETLFGKNISGGGGVVIDTGDYEEIADDLGDADSAASGTADGLSDAADSAKKLGHDLSVLPFDELNQLNKDTEKASSKPASGTSGAGGIGGLGDTGAVDGLIDQMVGQFNDNKLPDAISAWAERVKEAFKAKDWILLGEELAWGLNQGIEKLYKIFDTEKFKAKVSPYIDAFTETFNSLVDNIHWYQLGEAMGAGINDIVFVANRTMEDINWENLGSQFAEWANGLISEINWEEIGHFFSNKLNILWETALGFVTKFDWAGLGTDLGTGAGALVLGINYEAMVGTLIGGLQGLSKAVSNFAITFPWTEFGDELALNANKLIDKLPTWEFGKAIGDMIQNAVDGLNQLFDPEKGINFERLGVRLAIGLYSVVYHTKPETIGELLSNIFNSAWNILKGFISNLKPEELGAYVGTALRKAIRKVDGKLVGETLTQAWNKAWAFLKTAVTELANGEESGEGLGDKIHDTIVTIIDGITFEDAADTFTAFVKLVADTITDIFGKEDTWKTLGYKIGSALVKIFTDKELPSKLAGAVNAITHALLGLISGALEKLVENKDEIIAKFKEFIRELDWLAIAKVAAGIFGFKLATAFKDLALVALRNTMISKISALFGEVGASSGVLSASGAVFGGLKEALTGPGGIIMLAVEAAAELQRLVEIGRGGNGFLSEEGGAFDSYVEKLREMKIITKETDDQLFALKESWESHEIDDSEFFTLFAQTLEDAGVNAEQAESVIQKLSGQTNLTEAQMQALREAIKGIGTESSNSKEILEHFGHDTDEAIKLVSEAVTKTTQDFSEMGETASDSNTNINQAFADMVRSGGDFGQALLNILPYFEEVDGGVELIKQNIDAKLGKGAFDALIGSAETATEKAGGISDAMDDAATSTDTNTKAAENYQTTAKGLPDLFSTVKKAFSGLLDKLKGKGETDTTLTEYDGQKALDDYGKGMNGRMDTMVSDTEKGVSNIVDTVKTIAPGMSQAMDDGNSQVEQSAIKLVDIPQNVFQKHVRPGSPSKTFTELSESIPEGIAQGIANKESDVKTAITNLCDRMTSEYKSQLSSLKDTLKGEGQVVINDGLVSGMETALNNASYSISTSAISMMNTVISNLNGMNQAFWNAGNYLASWFKNGFESIYIKTPYIEPWGGYWQQFGMQWQWIPSFHVNWHKKGGLFTKPTIAGFGEAGDEAALPLENRRTMSRIANAIVDNSNGSFGISKADITSAVVQAMMANQNNRQPIIINAELRTEDNEVLARNVIRGMEQIDYRNNPTPQFG